MAIRNAPGKITAVLIGILMVVTLPLAAFFSLLNLPFVRRDIKRLNAQIKSDWLPRKKYIYLAYSDDHDLVHFAEELILRYGEHTIYDMWSPDKNEWLESEPDTYRRAVTMLQNIAGDYDAESFLLVGVITPDTPFFVANSTNTRFLIKYEDAEVRVNDEHERSKDAKRELRELVATTISQWQKDGTI